MGNYMFKLSDTMPNAWFYKLRDMGKSINQKHKRLVSSTRTTKTTTTTSGEREFSMPRYSYYYTTGERFYASPVNLKASDTHFPDPPRRSKKVRNNKNRNHRSSKHISSSVSAGCSCRTSLKSMWNPNDDGFESTSEKSKFGEQLDKVIIEWSRSCGCRVSSSTTDIIIDMERKSCRKIDVLDSPSQFSDITTTPDIELPPILTKPTKFNDLILDIKKKESESESEPILGKPTSVNLKSRAGDGDRINHGSLSVKHVKKESIKSFREQRSPLRKSSSLETASFGKTGSPISVGMKIKNRAKSPRLASKKIQAYNRKVMMTTNSKSRRKSFSESIAIVKSSYDPKRDFRDSMVEMIMGHNIQSSTYLEELLACYLSLNSNKYHDVIVKVFEQVWFPNIRL